MSMERRGGSQGGLSCAPRRCPLGDLARASAQEGPVYEAAHAVWPRCCSLSAAGAPLFRGTEPPPATCSLACSRDTLKLYSFII